MPDVGLNQLLLLAHGYGFAVVVGYVSARLDGQGWRVERARMATTRLTLDEWLSVAGGDNPARARWTQQVPYLNVGPVSLSLPWAGDLPE